MEVADKQRLTDEIVWHDLQRIRYERRPGGGKSAVGLMLLPFGCILAIGGAIVGLFIHPMVCLLCLPVAVLFALLFWRVYKQQKQDREKAFSLPLDADALVFDWDVCIKKVCGINDDPDILVFSNPYKEVSSDCDRYPWFHDTEVHDTFIVASLRGYSEVFKYYPLKDWYIEESKVNISLSFCMTDG